MNKPMAVKTLMEMRNVLLNRVDYLTRFDDVPSMYQQRLLRNRIAALSTAINALTGKTAKPRQVKP